MQVGDRVRSARDGQLGYLVETDGGLAVRLDRKAETRVVPFVPREWLPDNEVRLQPMQIARVAFEADRALRTVTGEYGLADWVSLKEPARVAWLKGIPGGGSEIRQTLYRAILKVLAK